MSRNLTSNAWRAISAESTDKAAIGLLTITHPDLGASNPLRFADALVSLSSRGHTFIGFPFQFTFPRSSEDQLPRVTVKIDNVDRSIVRAIRSLASPPAVTLEVVVSNALDTVEAGPIDLQLKDASYDALVVTGALGAEPFLYEPWPSSTFNPQTAPGLF